MNTRSVNVGCKVPQGLTIDFPDKSRVTLRGPASHLPPAQTQTDGRNTYTSPAPLPASSSIGVTTLTGADAENFLAWLERSVTLGPVKHGAVFVIEGSVEDAIAANRGDLFRGVKPDARERVRVSR